MSKIIGYITDVEVFHGSSIVAKATLADASAFERLHMMPVGMEIGGKWGVTEPSRWQRFRMWLGYRIIGLGRRVHG